MSSISRFNKNLEAKNLKPEEISIDVYNAIIAIYERYAKFLARSFPANCPDDDNTVYGYAKTLFIDFVKGHIPKIEYHQYKYHF